MSKNLFTEKGIKRLFGLGCLSHLLNFYLRELTLRNQLWTWWLLLIPTLIGATYLFRQLELDSKQSYRNISGFRLKAYQLAIFLFILLGSGIMFGGFLDSVLLGTNYLITKEDVHAENFIVLNAGPLKRGSGPWRKFPRIKISNGRITDEVYISDRYYDASENYPVAVHISYRLGCLGWGTIETVEVKQANRSNHEKGQ
ncbi:hypothetical protein [Flavilitoribacter nigricans]|uniref:Uncharacterized protein n=1 Tax=Flavilitoribacter nigricans (strain ATCC 23147 / DSM 23189 / NBRC 102662 / NCIMB 1420 / SS-2) TaxID=1122177 RepID=A0A2D0N2T8_FLAN2|nr:hypothetical protein [Flavilitoribacter nigricans]PHN02815.1 hypothetical protein CRP01_29995 [Flavilitoribacter nigricans DSM 23189 = NBRC 102662]